MSSVCRTTTAGRCALSAGPTPTRAPSTTSTLPRPGGIPWWTTMGTGRACGNPCTLWCNTQSGPSSPT
eukprot:1441725-Lingulodinium_polyedra.AAC.1